MNPVPPLRESDAVEETPFASTGGRVWNGRRHVFYLLSILVHVAAVAALMTSWTRSEPGSKPMVAIEPPRAEPPQVARLAIDLAPVKTCDMKIDSLVREIPPKKVARNPFAPLEIRK